MIRKIDICALCLLMGTGFQAQAFAQEKPALRVIERDVSGAGTEGSCDGSSAVAATGVTAAATSHKNEPARKGDAARVLPVSDVRLPARITVSKKQKKSLSGNVASAMRAGALRNTSIGMSVVDLDTGETVYEKNADRFLKPASNTKLITTASALGIFGPGHRFETVLLRHGNVEKGVLRGDLQLHIDHDFTWSTSFYNSCDVPMLGLIQQLKAAGIKKITGRVIVSGYVVYGGKATNTLSTSSHLQRAGAQFGRLLRRSKISHRGVTVRQSAKRNGDVVARWYSPVLSEAIVTLNRVSHNEYADMLLLAMGAEKYGKNKFSSGVKAEMAWLKSIGLDTKGVKLNDGSGLSHNNRVSTEFLTSLISWVVTKSPFAREWTASLSVSGCDGTYGGRLAFDDGLGRVYAKSGTLHDVISGSGVFFNRYDGHTYAFSTLVNGNRNRKQTRAAIDRMLRPFLADFHGQKLPSAPKFESFRRERDGRTVARWNGVSNAVGYRVYRSRDGKTWDVAAETGDTVLIMPDEAAHLRVTAVAENGAESRPSLIFSYRPGKKMMTILEQARCLSDADVRPVSHLFAHERPLADFVGDEWGVETVRTAEAGTADGLLMHSASCGGSIAWSGAAYEQARRDGIPVIVNVADAHLSADTKGACNPDGGSVLGCFENSVVTRDRRFGDRSHNYRLRKAVGSGSARPTAVRTWHNGSTVMKMSGSSVGVCEKDKSGGSLSVIGIDLQAVDSRESLDEAWRLLGI